MCCRDVNSDGFVIGLTPPCLEQFFAPRGNFLAGIIIMRFVLGGSEASNQIKGGTVAANQHNQQTGGYTDES